MQRDTIKRAAAVIDRDPEEAQARLQQQAAPGTQVTMADVMDLMKQMTQMVSATMGGMQLQIEDLKQSQRKPGEKSAWTEEDLARLNDQQTYLRTFWASEPQVPFYVVPSLEEQRMKEAIKAREYPPRAFEVNGVKFWLKPGQQPPEPIPQSIADRLADQQGGYRPIHNDAPEGLDTIPSPPRTYLATEAGRPGNLGKGPIAINNLPPQPIGMAAR